MTRKIVHILLANDAKEAPFAYFTMCGIDLRVHERTSALWPDEILQGSSSRWCPSCRAQSPQHKTKPESWR